MGADADDGRHGRRQEVDADRMERAAVALGPGRPRPRSAPAPFTPSSRPRRWPAPAPRLGSLPHRPPKPRRFPALPSRCSAACCPVLDGGTSWTAAAVLPTAVTELTAVVAAGQVLLAGAGDAGALVSVAGAPLAPARLPGSHRVTCAGGSGPRLLRAPTTGSSCSRPISGRSWSRVTGGPPTRHDLLVITHQLPGSPVHAILDTGQDDMLLARAPTPASSCATDPAGTQRET